MRLKLQKFLRWVLIFGGCFAYILLFPQITYKDCVHPVCPEEKTDREEAEEEHAGDVQLEAEDYIRLFDLSRSDFKIAWGFLRE